MYFIKMDRKKEQAEKILEILKSFGKLPTARLSAIVGINYDYLKPLLEELLKNKRIKKIKETLATYWELNEDG